ncbi:MAG: DEAD/DEAH box helicase family protein [Candidatus Micrarchaeota archaeon]|nr:DEAD/DEAH box helicase family protein [Candidatus Micrarchaeota archaeon]
MKKNIIHKNQLQLPFEEKSTTKIFNKPLEERIIKEQPINFPPIHFKKEFNYEKREYQEECITKILQKEPIASTLIIFPAGSGKTFIAARIMDKFIDRGKILVLCPRVSLSYQLTAAFRKYFDLAQEDICCLAAKPAEDRKKAYQKAKIIVSTPQGIANDLKKYKNLKFNLVVFDEVDFGVGDYQYVQIAKKAIEDKTPLIGLSATVGQIKKIKELVLTFNFEKIFIKLEQDPDIKPYRREIVTTKNIVELEEPYKKMYQIIDQLFADYIQKLGQYIDLGTLQTKKYISIEDLQEIAQQINRDWRWQPKSLYALLLNLYELKRIILEESKEQIILKLKDLIKRAKEGKKYPSTIFKELGSTSFKEYLKEAKLSKKVEMFLVDIELEKICANEKQKKLKVIVVCTSREFATFITKKLLELQIKAAVYLGQGEGFSKKDQLKVLESFLNSDLEVIVSTKSAIERGIDLPNANILYVLNPTSSESSYIQLLNRINRGANNLEASLKIYAQGEVENLKAIIAKRKTEKYYNLLKKLRMFLEQDSLFYSDSTPLIKIIEQIEKEEEEIIKNNKKRK